MHPLYHLHPQHPLVVVAHVCSLTALCPKVREGFTGDLCLWYLIGSRDPAANVGRPTCNKNATEIIDVLMESSPTIVTPRLKPVRRNCVTFILMRIVSRIIMSRAYSPCEEPTKRIRGRRSTPSVGNSGPGCRNSPCQPEGIPPKSHPNSPPKSHSPPPSQN